MICKLIFCNWNKGTNILYWCKNFWTFYITRYLFFFVPRIKEIISLCAPFWQPICSCSKPLLTHWSQIKNVCHFTYDIFIHIFLNENIWISIKISMMFIPKGPINNIPALVQIMACCRPGGKALSEPMMVGLPTHICITPPQWDNDECINEGDEHWWNSVLWGAINDRSSLVLIMA